MKSRFFLSLFVLLSAMVVFVISCSYIQDEDGAFTEHTLSNQKKGVILEEATLLWDDIYLPKSTYWYYANEHKNQVVFELPEHYTFLLKNVETGAFTISKDGGGYSCSCDSGGSCTTFYNKDLGFGCLQNSCKGTCSGKATETSGSSLKIVGVLNAQNDSLDPNTNQVKASVSNEGLNGFFEVKQVVEEIKNNYDFIYYHMESPDFESGIYDPGNYVFASILYYGIEVGIIVPNDEGLKEFMPELKLRPISDIENPSSCSCSGGAQGGSCILKKKKILLFAAYFCDGCTTCTMS